MRLRDFFDASSEQEYLIQLLSLNLIVDAGDCVDDDCLQRLSIPLSKCIHLEEFVLKYGFIGSRSEVKYQILFDTLKHFGELKVFDISCNHVGYLIDDDIEFLAKFIDSSNLEKINLNDNNLNELSLYNFKKLFNAMQSCKKLKHLYWSHNDLHIVDDHKFEIMCDCLRGCKNLIDFHMSVPYLSKQRTEIISVIIKETISQRIYPQTSSIIITTDHCCEIATTMGSFSTSNQTSSNVCHTIVIDNKSVVEKADRSSRCTLM